MNAVFRLIRPLNCLMGAIGVLIGALLGVGLDILSRDYHFQLSLGMIIAFFFMAGGNMMNDYFDRELDKINHPERPIPAGKVKASDVIRSVILIYIILIVMGFLINLQMLFILLIAMILMVGYEISLKRRGFIGNITISILVGLLFIFGAAVVLEFGVVIYLSILAALATLTREIVKDIEDMEGDIDRITLPKKIGKKKASLIASGSLLIAIVLSPIPVFPEWLPLFEFDPLDSSYLILILIADTLFVISILYFVRNPKLSSNILKGGMFMALLAFIMGSLI